MSGNSREVVKQCEWSEVFVYTAHFEALSSLANALEHFNRRACSSVSSTDCQDDPCGSVIVVLVEQVVFVAR
jgi:hypothetical protein